MRRSISLFVLACLCTLSTGSTLTGCIEPGCEPTVITISPSYTVSEGGVAVANCGEPQNNGNIDYSPCCPDGWDMVGITVITSDGSLGVLCERDCKDGEAAIARAENAVTIIGGALDGGLLAVEEVYSPTP